MMNSGEKMNSDAFFFYCYLLLYPILFYFLILKNSKYEIFCRYGKTMVL